MTRDVDGDQGEKNRDGTATAKVTPTEAQGEPTRAAPAEPDPLDLTVALTRFREAERVRESDYAETKVRFRARKGVGSAPGNTTRYDFQAANDLQSTSGSGVWGEDGRQHDAVTSSYLEEGWAAARKVRDAADRRLTDARDHYLEARRAANERVNVEHTRQQVEFARRSAEAAEAMKASAETQADMAREQSAAAVRSARAAENSTNVARVQTRIAEKMRRYTCALIIVGSAQAIMAVSQIVMAVVVAVTSPARPTAATVPPDVSQNGTPAPSGAASVVPPSSLDGTAPPADATASDAATDGGTQ